MSGSVHFHPTERDYLIANRAWLRRAVFSRRYAAYVAIGAGVVAAIGAATTWDEPYLDVRLLVTFGMIATLLGWVLAMGVVNWLLQPRTARRLFRQHRALNRDFVVEWDEAGVTYRYDDSISRTAWHDYHDWYDGRGVVLLLLNDRLFHFIPHHVLKPEQLGDLRALAVRAGEIAPPLPSG